MPKKMSQPPAPLEERDGPTEEYRRHHNLTYRSHSPARRKLTRLEQLLLHREISPQASEAGRRIALDYLVGYVGRSACSLHISSVSTNNWERCIDDRSHEAAGRYEAAANFLDADRKQWSKNGRKPSSVLVSLCVHDESFKQIGTTIGRSGDSTKTYCRNQLEALALHYKDVDEKRGLTVTAGTYESALENFDPKDD
jgi:hypothetical protein